MTEIRFFKTRTGWCGFRAKGHTGSADHGEDVVCAAVSALTQTAVIGLKEVLRIRCRVETDEATGLLICLLPTRLSEAKWKQAQLVLRVLYAGLSATSRAHSKYVRVKEAPYREDEFTTIRFKKRWWQHQKR